MKKLYRFKYNSETLIANREELEVELQRSKNLLQNYLEIESNIDAPEYVARGNRQQLPGSDRSRLPLHRG